MWRMSKRSMHVHATCIALGGDAGWQGVLLLGESGAGKSELALRLIDAGARLVADDQTILTTDDGVLQASAPPAIAGLIEARGLGLLALPAAHRLDRVAPVAAVELVAASQLERLPDPDRIHFLDVALPRWQVVPFEPSAAARIRLGVAALAERRRDAASGSSGPDAAMPYDVSAAGRRRPTVLVTGLSGAGRATALNALEDLGYVAVDNMPLPLLDTLLRAGSEDRYAVAFGVDVRTWGFDGHAMAARLDSLRSRADLAVQLVYLDCDTEVLLRRYTETRRPHPLAQDRPVQDAIADERRLLAVLRDVADRTIDTSTLSPHDLKRILAGHFAIGAAPCLRIAVVSFSFRRGLPREADMVLDARFLRNPHYVAALRPLDGRDAVVRDFVAADPGWTDFMQRVEDLLAELLPRFDAEGKTYLTIAIGCTGGRHRSVVVAGELADRLRRRGRDVAITHRDVALASSPQGTANTAVAMPTPFNSPRNIAPEGVQ